MSGVQVPHRPPTVFRLQRQKKFTLNLLLNCIIGRDMISTMSIDNPRQRPEPTTDGMMQKYNQRGVHELEDLLDFGMLNPDEARVMRRQLGRPESQPQTQAEPHFKTRRAALREVERAMVDGPSNPSDSRFQPSADRLKRAMTDAELHGATARQISGRIKSGAFKRYGPYVQKRGRGSL